MARQRISLVSDEVLQKSTLEAQIRSKEINPDNFNQLSLEEQGKVNELLFKMASEKIEPNQGLSAVEFILMAHIRLTYKKLSGLAFTEDEKKMEATMMRIMDMHEITNTSISMDEWLFDYMGYAELKAHQFLKNRKEHIERKTSVTGRA